MFPPNALFTFPKFLGSQFFSIRVLDEIQSGVQPSSIRPVVQTRVGGVVILWSKNALPQNDPFQSIIAFLALRMKEKRGITEPPNRGIPKAVVALSLTVGM